LLLEGYAVSDYAWAGQIGAPAAIAVGVLICFLGYRILKVTLGITGFLVGATGVWMAAASLIPNHNGIALACAVVGGITGAILCVWLFYLGVFLVGVSAGVVVASAVFGGTGHQVSPVVLLAVAIGFGVLALVLQKFMIIVSTALSGSHLITAGILHLANIKYGSAPLWFDPAQSGSAGVWSWVALAFWLLLGLEGARFQYGSGRKKAEGARHEAQSG
jgi:hypothetical protein